MKLKLIIFCISIPIFSFALEINSIKFDKSIQKNEKVQKEFYIRNSGREHLSYTLEIEGNPKHITVLPKQLIIKKGNEKKFIISIYGKGTDGSNSYYLLVKEKLTKSNDNGLALNKTYRIKQQYFLGEILDEYTK